jgi:hypothetical protein
MEIVNVGRWNLKTNCAETCMAHSGVPIGSPESCGCEQCLNFASARDRAYPPEALAIFEQLGIDPRKESEIWYTHRDESGMHHYGGFFHFVGCIESGKDAKQIVNEVRTFDLEPIEGYFEFAFTSNAQLIPESFSGKQIVQLEFQTRVPWVLKTPEPD